MLIDTEYPLEYDRINFVIERDGLKKAIEFAKQTLKVYRKSVLHSAKRGIEKPHHASFRDFRPKFIKRYLEFKRLIATYEGIV